MPATSPAQALGLILHGPSKTANEDIVLLDYRDPATFSALWLQGLELGKWNRKVEVADQREPISLTDSTKQFLLIGNDPPDGIFDTKIPALAGINFRSHFTATSWLAAWKVKFPGSKVPIAVIDPRESRNAQGAARTLQAILGARDTSNQSLVPNSTVLNAPNLTEFCQWLKFAKTDNRTVTQDTPHLCELLKSTIWNELISNREQHHALSNVLGAFLLGAAVGGERADASIQLTQQLLDVLARVCDIGTGAATTGCGGVQAWVEKDLWRGFDGAVLIDDMADLWGGFLTAALGGDPMSVRTTPGGQFRMSVVGDRNALTADGLSGLPASLADVIRSGRERLVAGDLVPKSDRESDQSSSWENFVLFLDLRLGLDASFHDQLCAVARQLLKSSRNLAWLAADGARAAFERDLNGNTATDTLLPRLISLIDPTLPIVIFSSTRHTDLIDPFRDYGNIITTFRKPVLSGLTAMWREVVEDLKSDFVSALEQAVRVIAVRRKIQHIQREASISKASRMQFAKGKAYHAEIYVDEGTGDLAPVGGVFAVFEGNSIEEAQTQAQAFDDALVMNGVRYFKSHSIGPQPGRVKRKEDDCLEEMKQTLSRLKPSFLGALRVRLKNTTISTLPHSSTFDQFDQNWFGGFEAVLELFMGEWLGSATLDYDGVLSLAVFVATRSAPPKKDGDIEKARFCSGWETTNNLIQTFNRRDCWRIVRGILEERNLRALLDRAVGVPLVYENTPTGRSQKAKEWFLPKRGISVGADGNANDVKQKLMRLYARENDWRPDYRALLYAADACLKKWGNWSSFLNPNAADLKLDASLAQIAVSGRHLDNGRTAKSLLSFPLTVSKENQAAASHLASRLSRAAAMMSRSEFLQAFKETSRDNPEFEKTFGKDQQEKPYPEPLEVTEVKRSIQPAYQFGLRLRVLPESVTSVEALNEMLGRLGLADFLSSFAYLSTTRRDARILFATNDQREQAYAKTKANHFSEKFDLK